MSENAASFPQVSVIVPAYNAAGTIENSLRSVLEQRLPPLEIIVVDDGCTDDTVARVQALCHPAIRLVRFSVNRGPAAARNVGLDAATGSLIAYLDADDAWHPNKLAYCVQAWQAHPGATLLYHDRTTEPLPAELPDQLPVEIQSWRSLLLTNPVATPAAMHSAALRLRWNEALRYMEDHDFFLRCAEAGPVLFLHYKLVRLGRPLLSAGGLSGNIQAMRRGERAVFRSAAKRRPFLRLLLPLLLAASYIKAWLRPYRKVR